MSDIGLEASGQLAVTGEDKGIGEGKEEKREAVLALLQIGTTVADTARTTGVTRQTIYNWLRRDPVFQAAYNQWHDEMEKGAQSRLLMMTEKAMNALEKSLESGDARAALQLLKGLGMMRERAVGPTDPKEVKSAMELEDMRRKAKIERQTRMAQFDAEMGQMGGIKVPFRE